MKAIISGILIGLALFGSFSLGRYIEHHRMMAALMNDLPGIITKALPHGCRP